MQPTSAQLLSFYELANRHALIAGLTTPGVELARRRNMSGGSTGSVGSGRTSPTSSVGSNSSYDFSAPSSPRSHILPLPLAVAPMSAMCQPTIVPAALQNAARYKTELCRQFEESGECKYGEKCQFAHGVGEIRVVSRHPKYKTELCRTYHSTGLCPYGPRCHFIHNDDERKMYLLRAQQQAQAQAQQLAALQRLSLPVGRPILAANPPVAIPVVAPKPAQTPSPPPAVAAPLSLDGFTCSLEQNLQQLAHSLSSLSIQHPQVPSGEEQWMSKAIASAIATM